MTKNIMNTALRTSGHYIDINTNTLYVTTAFNKKAEIYGTPECIKLDDILAMFPDMKVVVQTKSRSNDAIPYDMMEKYIRIMPDAQSNLTEFERVKKMSHAHRSAYQFVAEWFKAKFPHYGKLVVVDEKTGEIMWDALDNYKKAATEAEDRAAKKTAAASEADTPAEKPNLTLLAM